MKPNTTRYAGRYIRPYERALAVLFANQSDDWTSIKPRIVETIRRDVLRHDLERPLCSSIGSAEATWDQLEELMLAFNYDSRLWMLRVLTDALVAELDAGVDDEEQRRNAFALLELIRAEKDALATCTSSEIHRGLTMPEVIDTLPTLTLYERFEYLRDIIMMLERPYIVWDDRSWGTPLSPFMIDPPDAPLLQDMYEACRRELVIQAATAPVCAPAPEAGI